MKHKSDILAMLDAVRFAFDRAAKHVQASAWRAAGADALFGITEAIRVLACCSEHEARENAQVEARLRSPPPPQTPLERTLIVEWLLKKADEELRHHVAIEIRAAAAEIEIGAHQ